MRIIGGRRRGFQFPEKAMPHVRPTTDRAKESLFSILNGIVDFEEISVLDLYAGLGGIGFEFWSRGCNAVTMVDSSLKSTRYIDQISKALDAEVKNETEKCIDFISSCSEKFDVIFADPPYHAGQEIHSLISAIEDSECLAEGGIFVLEHATALQISNEHITQQRKYGQSTFTFFTFE